MDRQRQKNAQQRKQSEKVFAIPHENSLFWILEEHVANLAHQACDKKPNKKLLMQLSFSHALVSLMSRACGLIAKRFLWLCFN